MFVHRLQVRFRDLDALNHVNNAVYLTYLEESRIAMMSALGVSRLMTRERSWILARTEIDYRLPAVLGDLLRIEVHPEDIRNSSFALRYRITRDADGKLIAEARSVQVCYDFVHGHPTRVPQDWRERLLSQSRPDPVPEP